MIDRLRYRQIATVLLLFGGYGSLLVLAAPTCPWRRHCW